MTSKLAGSTGASILAQVAFVIYLVAGAVFTLVAGPADIYALASLVFVVIFGALVWMCWRGRPLAFLGSSVLGIVLLAIIPISLRASDEPLVVWEAALGAAILLIVAIEGIISYAELKGKSPN